MERIIVAADGVDSKQILKLAEACSENTSIWGIKLNSAILEDPTLVYRLKRLSCRVMYDLKFYDIPSTMDRLVDEVLNQGADIVTVHCTANYNPIKLKKYVAGCLAGVTVLTSFDSNVATRIYNNPIMFTIQNFVENVVLPYHYGFVVCSARDLNEVPQLKNKQFLRICPGIKTEWSIVNKPDQKRVTTSKQALKLGADLLVIGRDIVKCKGNDTTVKDMVEAIKKTNKEMEG
jgi:orotidine-5'-phosphate decarboxylase